MSTGKRIISVLLAVTMMLTLIPSSIFAIDENTSVTTAGNRIGEGPDWIADTSKTTEILRLGSSSYKYGNTIIAATESGIPAVEGESFGASAYGGETPITPTVCLELSGNSTFFRNGVLGIGGTGGTDNPTAYVLESDGSTSAVSVTLVVHEAGEDSGYSSFERNGETWTTKRWTWVVSGSIGDTNLSGVGKNIIYVIPYSVNGQSYTAYAYSHVEKILRPNGYVFNWKHVATWAGHDDETIRLTGLINFVGKNVYSGWLNRSGIENDTDNKWGYINYNCAKSNLDGSSLKGCGQSSGFNNDTNKEGAFGVSNSGANGQGTVYKRADDSTHQNNDGAHVTNYSDTCICKSTIYVDTGYEHLGFGKSGSKDGLNLRLTYQISDAGGAYTQYFNSVGLYNGSASESDMNALEESPTASVAGGTVAVDQSACYWRQTNPSGTDAERYASIKANNSLYAGDSATSADFINGKVIMCRLSGDATKVGNHAEYNLFTQIKDVADVKTKSGYYWKNSDTAKPELKKGVTSASATTYKKMYTWGDTYFKLDMYTYNTVSLRTLFEGITKGCTNDNQTSYNGTNFKVSNPEAFMFHLSETDSKWVAFVDAYNYAGALLATPDIPLSTKNDVTSIQNTIDTAYETLKTAYDALPDIANYQIKVEHVLEDGTEIIAPQIYQYISTDASVGRIYTAAEVATMSSDTYRPIVGGDSFQITADKLKGYTFSDNSTGTGEGIGYVFHTADGDTTVTEFSGTKRVVICNTDVKIYYRYNTYKLTYYPNFDEKVGEDFSLAYKSYINDGGESDTYGVGGQLRNYDGGNTNHTFVGFSKGNTAANGGTAISNDYTMPSEAISVYANWKVNGVDLKVNNGTETKTMITGTAPTLVSGTENIYTYGGTSYTDGEVESVTFAQPTDDQKQSAARTGTNVVGFYYDAEHTQPVSWPLTVSYDPSDALSVVASEQDGVNDYVTIYAWCEDLNYKIVFETNYGQLPEGVNNPLTYTGGQSIQAPQPTKEGYTFAGWEDVNGQLISGWHYVDGGVSKYDGLKTMNSSVGFIAYARWTGDQRTIYFDVNTPKGVTNYAFNSANDVVYNSKSCFYYIQGVTGETITNFDEVPEPRMYGYTFGGWADSNGKIYTGKVWPTTDTTLKAKWIKDSSSAFIEIDAYEKLEGNLVQVGTEVMNGTKTEDIKDANPGDVVTVRFTSTNNFYTGSAMFAVMYDKDFFSPYIPKTMAGYTNTVDFANVNPENDYVKGTGARLDYNYDLSEAAQSYIWPTSLSAEKSDYNVVLVSLEPDVSVDTAVKPTKMTDGTWLFEMRFKVNPGTTKTKGSIWMDNAWTRTEDNSKGITFYGVAANNKPDSMWTTTNNAVTPDLYYAGTTVEVAGTIRTNTTVTAEITNSVGSSVPEFSDGAGTTRTYTGPISTEIYSFPFPVTPGYELGEYWVKKNGTVTTTTGLSQQQINDYVTSGDIWYAGYMANANQNEKTYVPQWTAKTYSVKFMSDTTGTKIDKANNLTVTFDTTFKPGKAITKTGYTLDHWVDEETGDTLVFDASGNATLDYNLLFGKTRTSEAIVYRPVFVPNNYDIIIAKTSASKSSEYKIVKPSDIIQYAPEAELPTFGSQYRLVKTIPTERQENTYYLTVDQLLTVLKKGDPSATVRFYDATAKKDIYEINVNDPIFVGNDGQGLLISKTTVQTTATNNKFILGDALKGYDVTITFAPDKDTTGTGATFPVGVTVDGNGNYVKVISAGTAIDPVEIPLPEKYGYVSDGSWYQYTTKVTTTKLAATTALYADTTFTTKFVAKNVIIKAYKENGTDLFYSDAAGYNFGSTVNLLDAAKYVQTDKQYYNMTGYRMAQWNATENKYEYTTDDTLLTSYKIDTEGTLIDDKNTICLLPVFEPANINYTVEFYYENLSGGYDKLSTDTTKSATYKTSKTINPTTDYAAKELTGFDYDSTNANNVLTISEISGDPTANKFKVYYKRETHTVTFKANDVVYGDVKTLKYGESIVAPAVDPTSAESGKVFVKWSPDLASTMGTENLEYTAVFANEANKITFKVKGGSYSDYYEFDTKNIAAGDPATVTTKAFETGYESNGKWYTNPECTSEYTFGSVITEPVILYTTVTPIIYSITFYNDGVKYGETLYFAYGTNTAKAGDNTKPGTDKYSNTVTDPIASEGKKFDGWYEDSSYTIPHTFGTMGAGNIELYGHLIDNTGSVIFYYGYDGAPNDGIYYQLTDVVVGTLVNPSNPTRDGYTFSGWNKTVTEVTVGTTEVTANWSKAKYTVIYVAIDATQPENSATVSITAIPGTDTYNSYRTYTNVEYESTLEKPSDPSVPFFKFIKWLDKDDVEHTTMPALALGATLYLFPQFERITVTLLEEKGDGKEISKENSDAKTDPKEIKEIDDGEGGKIKVGYIYDFAEGLDAAAIISQLAVKGNGSLIVTPYYQIGYEITTYTTCGTGSTVELIDNVTGKTIERYYIIIFGDINGDGRANSTDCSYIRNGKTTSENAEMAACILKAGDINYDTETGAIVRDGVINQTDMFIISKLTARKLVYDRKTGTMSI